MLILLPPSEGKATGGSGRFSFSGGHFGELSPRRREVAAALKAAMADDAAAGKLLGVKGAALAHAVAANRAITTSSALPAHARYSGVVWSHLDPTTLSDQGRARAADGIVVVSALLGLVQWADPTPDYKLKIGSRLQGVGSLTSFWRPLVTKHLRKRFAGHVVVDLLPADYAKAVDFDGMDAPSCVHVRFVDGDRNAVGHNAKAAKGLFARHLLEVGDVNHAVETFAQAGWHGVLGDEHTAFITTD